MSRDGDRLRLTGPAGAITPEIITAAEAHRGAILALLPPGPPGDEERGATAAEEEVAPAEAVRECKEWDEAVALDKELLAVLDLAAEVEAQFRFSTPCRMALNVLRDCAIGYYHAGDPMLRE